MTQDNDMEALRKVAEEAIKGGPFAVEGVLARGVLSLLSELEAVKGDADLCAKSWVKEIESNNARQDELREIWEMLNFYEAPTHDQGEEGGPLSLAGRIEAMVYRDSVRAEAALASLKEERGSSGNQSDRGSTGA